MGDQWLAERFEEHRVHLRAVAYRMLGSFAEADDAVQDTWVRVSRAGADEVENLSGWLTTIVSRVCLNVLRARAARREQPLEPRLPDPVVTPAGQLLPEDEAVLADSVGLALQVVLDTLAPAERLAFVLHDLFDLPFDEIATVIGRTPDATRQLASRARRRLPAADARQPERDSAHQRAVVDAFLAAGRAGVFDALLALLDPDAVLRADFSPGQPRRSVVVRGASAVATRARAGGRRGVEAHPVLVNGAAGVVITQRGVPVTIMAFTVVAGTITEIDAIGDPARVDRLVEGVLHAGM